MDSTLALGAFRIARGAGGEAVREREPRRAGEASPKPPPKPPPKPRSGLCQQGNLSGGGVFRTPSTIVADGSRPAGPVKVHKAVVFEVGVQCDSQQAAFGEAVDSQIQHRTLDDTVHDSLHLARTFLEQQEIVSAEEG